eukprot:m.66885 g.66885  ORF g.66885 m.66885 type:complete len:130 (+) comp8198_c2_seq3:85-474(+)
MSCPVMNTMPSELSEALAEFGKLLPSCKKENQAVHDCRVTVAEASAFNKILWQFGFGISHCVEEVKAARECHDQRNTVSAKIMQHCLNGDHQQLAKQYNACLNQNNGDSSLCKPLLANFLDCARAYASS